MIEDRAARRRRERAEAKLYRRIDRRYEQADKTAVELLPMLERMLDEARRRGWDDVAVEVETSIGHLHAGEGIELQRRMAEATSLINVHEPPEPPT